LPLEVNADPFLMAVAVAASCAFLTPIGQKNDTLILGPGGCRFGDYWRMGPPLAVLIVLVGIPMILLVWPFRGEGLATSLVHTLAYTGPPGAIGHDCYRQHSRGEDPLLQADRAGANG
jgi:hypothetical protein